MPQRKRKELVKIKREVFSSLLLMTIYCEFETCLKDVRAKFF